MLVLKRLFDWSYDDLEREVRANLVYRTFTRIDAGEVPDAKTILEIGRVLGPDVIEQLHRQVGDVAERAGVTHGRRFRIDTTVVEMNVRDPTDSSLLQDGGRVLTRALQRANTALVTRASTCESPAQRGPTRPDHWTPADPRKRGTRLSAAIDS